MKERPILFSAPMVRAIMDGRKTQTRRVVKPQPHEDWKLKSCGILTCEAHSLHAEQVAIFDRPDGLNQPYKFPYGQPGDQLWVREAWRIGAWDENRPAFALDYCDGASKEWIEVPDAMGDDGELFDRIWQQSSDDAAKALGIQDRYQWEPGQSPCRWRPSIHMPRWASRIQLEITVIRVERLQDISEADALAEGIQAYSDGTYRDYNVPDDKVFDHYTFASPVDSYRTLWDTINGPGSWEANPWVWVIEFRRIKP